VNWHRTTNYIALVVGVFWCPPNNWLRREGMMRETTVFGLALMAALTSVSISNAQSAAAPGPDAIRAKLLATPVWIFEDSHGNFVNTGRLRFEQQGDKLIAKLDIGLKCESDVELLPDAFVFEGCAGPPRTMKFNPDDTNAPFKNIFGSYTYIVRPAAQ
jgi:hypothetical protein